MSAAARSNAARGVHMSEMPEVRSVTDGLIFPEGPIAMPDGSVLLVEIRRGTLTRVRPDGNLEVVAELGGGPNGAAIGPDGAAYVCNNGGFAWEAIGTSNAPSGYTGGWIERVDIETGASTVLYRECDGRNLRGPNDIVFDAEGGFWFTDLGKRRQYDVDLGGVFYARPDGSSVTTGVFPLMGPNGVGLSPDGGELYVAETWTGRLWAFELRGPGQVVAESKRCIAATRHSFDSLAVEADGHVVVAAIDAGLFVVRPDGSDAHFVAMPDTLTTNVCFGGADLRTAYVTLSGGGRLVATDWPRPGLQLPF
jgi:gluconolactonase